MSRAPCRVTALIAVSLCLLAVATAVIVGIANRSPGGELSAGATTADASTPAVAPTQITALTTVALPTTIGGASTSTTIAVTTTTHPPGFVDAAEARDAAESLVPAYIQSQYGATVTDAACSLPATGAAGDEFVCYVLRPGDLVIALRATIGANQLLTLALITDEGAPTTTVAAATTTSTT